MRLVPAADITGACGIWVWVCGGICCGMVDVVVCGICVGCVGWDCVCVSGGDVVEVI